LQRDAISFASDLTSLRDNKAFMMHDVYEFRPMLEQMGRDEGLFGSMIDDIFWRAEAIIKEERQVRSIAEHTGQMIYAISSYELTQTNIKLQKGIFWMTLAILALTLVVVFATFASSQYLRDMFNVIIGNIK
jgi:hypothetical protein